MLGAPHVPTLHPRRAGRGLVSCRAHCWEVVALGLNPTRLLLETATLCRLPVRAGLQAFLGSGLALGLLPFRSCPHNLPIPLLPQSYTPTVFERLSVNLQMKGNPVELQIWDTAGGCARARGGTGWKERPRCWEPSPTPFLLNRGGPAISKGQVWARIRAPRN